MVRRALLLTAALGVLATVAGAAAEGSRHSKPCANLRGAANHTGFLRPGTLRADVTGDGAADRVAVVEDRRVSFRCRFGVAVFSPHRTMVLPLGRFVDKPRVRSGQRWPFPQPLIRLLAALDRKRGAEIVVAVSASASSEQAELLTVRRGRLARLRLPRSFGGRLA
jgi:hypothetical protein